MFELYTSNGENRAFEKGTIGLKIAQSLNIKDPIAIFANQKLQDLCDPVVSDTPIKVITYSDSKALEIVRHDAAHLLAQAIQRIYPQAKIAIGPVTENGFYYDIDLATPITEADLPIITKEMHSQEYERAQISPY